MSTMDHPLDSRLPDSSTPIYTSTFWMAYFANLALVSANALTFRFAEFVNFLGGTEQIAGTIVSIGVGGALVARFGLGQAIDRYGTRVVWAITTVIFLLGSSVMLFAPSLNWTLFAARIAYAVGIAGMTTSSVVHIQNLVPPSRRTEMIASLGSSGFLGMILGSQLGDLLFALTPEGAFRYWILFASVTIGGLIYLLMVLVMTRHDVHTRPKETPPAHKLLFRYWPGPIVLVAMMMGTAFTVVSVFLTRFATFHGLRGIGSYFTAYAVTAFIFRIVSRQWSYTMGRNRMALFGLCGLAVGFTLLPFVRAEWQFIFPAICTGFGHALLFPVIVSLGAGSFPKEYRGTGTTLALGFTEIGSMMSAPLLGLLIDHYLPVYGFRPMFFTTAGLAVVIAGVFWWVADERTSFEVATPVVEAPIQNTCALPPAIAPDTKPVFARKSD